MNQYHPSLPFHPSSLLSFTPSHPSYLLSFSNLLILFRFFSFFPVFLLLTSFPSLLHLFHFTFISLPIPSFLLPFLLSFIHSTSSFHHYTTLTPSLLPPLPFSPSSSTTSFSSSLSFSSLKSRLRMEPKTGYLGCRPTSIVTKRIVDVSDARLVRRLLLLL